VIINSDKWEDAMRNETPDIGTGLRTTPMRKLIKKMPGQNVKLVKKMPGQNVKLVKEMPGQNVNLVKEMPGQNVNPSSTGYHCLESI
jgi:hypothetical protein